MHLEFEPWLSGSCRGCRGSVGLSELSCCRNCRAVVDSMTAHTHGHCRNCRSLVCRVLSGPVGAVGLSGCRAVGTVVVLSGNCRKKLSYCRTGAQSYQYNTDQKDTLVCTDRAVSRPSQIPYDLPYTDSAERERESEGPRGQKANRQTRTGCKERTSTRRTLSLRGTHKDEDAGGNRDTETETRGDQDTDVELDSAMLGGDLRAVGAAFLAAFSFSSGRGVASTSSLETQIDCISHADASITCAST